MSSDGESKIAAFQEQGLAENGMESKPSTLNQMEVNDSKQKADGGKINSSSFSNIHFEESKKGPNANKKVKLVQAIKCAMKFLQKKTAK